MFSRISSRVVTLRPLPLVTETVPSVFISRIMAASVDSSARAAGAPRGSSMAAPPASRRMNPSRTICRSLNRTVRNPPAARPAVIPRKNRPAYPAASSAGRPWCSVR